MKEAPIVVTEEGYDECKVCLSEHKPTTRERKRKGSLHEEEKTEEEESL